MANYRIEKIQVLLKINEAKYSYLPDQLLEINKEGKLGGKTTYDLFRQEFQIGGSITFTKVSDGSPVFGSMIDVK